MGSVTYAGITHNGEIQMEDLIQEQVTGLIGKDGWMFGAGVGILLFRQTIESFVAGIMIFMGNDYNEDDVVEVDGKPSRIVRVGMWSTTFFTISRPCGEYNSAKASLFIWRDSAITPSKSKMIPLSN